MNRQRHSVVDDRLGLAASGCSPKNFGTFAGEIQMIKIIRSASWRLALAANLAQAIVQTTAKGGKIKLQAEAAGLKTATATLISQ